ncbi:NAD-dependent epimerase/dehydratase family protein [Nocardia mexicana]|uniref:Nucleoside-diphosphate-sugar epimerase n=1 Tax=Nocardia mexicana TaxID=279262 RepID=A0A370H1A4_9NOCA|nr:NAD(P)-dependent oxidoreductase [Nocardia mexicana]RDI49743.1 nucleoside-diphosphate-sugar epimerase [Nocardia mexicana]
MRVVVAGASGAIGRPLVRRLGEAGHEVVALTRSSGGARRLAELGMEPIVANVLDRAGLLRAVAGVRADAVVHELTAYRRSPPTHYRSPGLRQTNDLRTTGTRNLLDVAKTIGAQRFVTQSLILGYGLRDHGTAAVTEDAEFGRPDGSLIDASLAALRTAEDLPARAPGIDSVALRYGFFYGPGASDVFARMLKLRLLPLPRRETGTTGWIHVDDAAAATVAALDRGRAGAAYNVVDDEPASWGAMFTELARAFGAPKPPRLPDRLVRMGAPLVARQMLEMSIRVSNAKAAAELEWRPALPSFREGVATLARSR